jgi:hypothetical protein
MNQVTLSNGFSLLRFPSTYVEAHKTVSNNVEQVEHKDEQLVTGQTVTNGEGKSGKGGVIIRNAHKATTSSKTPTTSNTTRTPVSSSSGGSSSSSSDEPSDPTTRDLTKKTDMVTRYKEVDDALDDLSDAYDRASSAADRLWGENRLDALRE